MHENTLDRLHPRARLLVMDLVHEAGLDVSDWSNFKGKHPSNNPKYCYEWVFRGDDKLVACLWFANLEVAASGQIVQRLNLWPLIKRHEGDGGRPAIARRARTLDMALQDAYRLKLPIRVIVVDGDQADLEREDDKSSSVKARLLDPEPWFVSEYDRETGQCLLVRGPVGPKYVDQFSEEVARDSGRTLRQGFAYDRSGAVRQRVLERAAGRCEYCGERGFETSTGEIYLETHHVVPLCEQGKDSSDNVAALCPDHHRQAHYGKDRDLIRDVLLDRLGTSKAA